MENIEFDVNSYTVEELHKIFNVTDKSSEDELETRYNEKIKMLYKLNDPIKESNLKTFFKQAHDIISGLYNFNAIIPDTNNYFVNPIVPDLVKQQIAVNSEFRKRTYADKIDFRNDNNKIFNNYKEIVETSTNTDFVVEFLEPISNVVSLELVNSDLPYLEYNFSQKKNNNRFKITITDASNHIVIPYIISIPDGLWYADSLATLLNDTYLYNIPSYNANNPEKFPEGTMLGLQDISNVVSGTAGAGGLSNNYLEYLLFNVDMASAKTSFRFMLADEITAYNNRNNVVAPNVLNYALLKSLSYTLLGIEDATCTNMLNVFSNTCLGRMGFELSDIYNIELASECIDKNADCLNKNKHEEIKYTFTLKSININNELNFGTTKYNGYIQSNCIYSNNDDTAFYISVDDFTGNHSEQIMILGDNTYIGKSVLARAQLKIGYAQTQFYNANQDFSIKRMYYGEVKIRKLHIKILNKYGFIVDMQRYPTNFVFEFTRRYSSETQDNYNKFLLKK